MKDDSSAFGADPKRINELLAWPLGEDSDGAAAASVEQFAEAPGGYVGRYRLVRILGEGGMGVVYLAEQLEPIRRQVALKVIKPGMDSQRVIARFEAEQQALATMDHPHVASIFDAGLAPSGRPYFVMEYVKGTPITEYCDNHQLTVEERLTLFLHVCEAIQHAHQKGIIHRDVKPSNILVTVQDQEASPRVIDFGVARAIGTPLTERTLYTEDGQLLGTPEYMSPEQADLGNPDIDTRTDVYSLGVLLYELLAGILPFDRKTLREGGIDHVRHVIREQEPATPSTKLNRTSAAESSEAARRRRTDVRTLQYKLRGDLDWITLKAMEKDRTRRYASVETLAADIRSHLNHQPVTAAPPGFAYRVRKFIRRHRQEIVGGAAVVIILAMALWALRTSVQAGRQRLYAETVEHQRALAEAQEAFNARELAAAKDAVAPLLRSPHVGSQATLLHAQLLLEDQDSARAIAALDSLLDAPADVSGQAHSILATIYYHQAGSSLGHATETVQRWQHHRAEAERRIGGTAQDYFLKACATSIVSEKLDLLDKALQQNRQHYDSLRERAYIRLAQHDYEKTLRDADRMQSIRPEDPQGYFLSATALRALRRFDEALADLDTAIGLEPSEARFCIARWQTYTRMGRHEAALADIRRCVELEPQDTLHPVRLAATLTALGRYHETDTVYEQYLNRPDLGVGFGTSLIGSQSKTLFDMQFAKLTYDMLASGITPYPSANPPVGPAYKDVYLAQQLFHEFSQNGRRVVSQGFHPSWSPDGTKLLYAMGFASINAVALLDLETGRTELLTIPGKDPEWSPDGRHVAFVRARTLLPPQRLAGLGVETFRSGYGPVNTSDDEVWVMNMETRRQHRIASGGWPHWGKEPSRLYYTSRRDGTLYSIAIDDEGAQPQIVLRGCSAFPVVSPNERYVADHEFRELRIRDLAKGKVVRRWLIPPRNRVGLFVNWSPDSRELSVCGWDGSETGLWVFNMETEGAAKVAGLPAAMGRWSGGADPKLAVAFSMPLNEIWIWDLEPHAGTAASFASPQNVEEHCRTEIERCGKILAVDPHHVDMHYLRVDNALWIRHERTQEFLAEFEEALEPEEFSAGSCRAFCALVLSSAAEIQQRLMPMVRLLARKAVEKEPGYARTLAPAFYFAGHHAESYELFHGYSDTAAGGSHYDRVKDTYVVTSLGVDIWETIDDFHFAHQTLHGDGSITARIDGIEPVHDWTKAGVMIRNTLDARSANAMVLVTPVGRVSFQNRPDQGGRTHGTWTPPGAVQLPHWVRLTREGSHLTAEHSPDGANWHAVQSGSESDESVSMNIPMNETVHIGLAVTSHDPSHPATAHFSDVKITGAVLPGGPFHRSVDICFQVPSPGDGIQ